MSILHFPLSYWVLLKVYHWQFQISYIFTVSLRFPTCSITDRCGDFGEKYATLHLHILFWYAFGCFSSLIMCFFIIFMSFFDEVSNFLNRLLTNQKQKFVIRIVSGSVCAQKPFLCPVKISENLWSLQWNFRKEKISLWFL